LGFRSVDCAVSSSQTLCVDTSKEIKQLLFSFWV
jgi:hypothetical protein